MWTDRKELDRSRRGAGEIAKWNFTIVQPSGIRRCMMGSWRRVLLSWLDGEIARSCSSWYGIERRCDISGLQNSTIPVRRPTSQFIRNREILLASLSPAQRQHISTTMSTFSFPTSPWIPKLDRLPVIIPDSVTGMDDMIPPPESSFEEDRSWTKNALGPLLDLVPKRRGDLWEAIVWIWRLKVIKEEGRDCHLWPRILRAWMVFIYLAAGVRHFDVVVDYAKLLESSRAFPPNSLLTSSYIHLPTTAPSSSLLVLDGYGSSSDSDQKYHIDSLEAPIFG